jgi:catechol 2,3-dioxygenase
MTVIDPSTRPRLVRLAVADLAASVDFYERVMGLTLIERDHVGAQLGADPGAPSLELIAIEHPTPAPPGSTGLFHVAWLHSSRSALAETVKRIAATGWPLQGASDHGVSEALYLSDPDGLGIEIYADRPREAWPRQPGEQGVEMATLALDLEDLLASFPDEPGERMAPGTGVGHVHLKVADVEATERFYLTLGFEEQARLPAAAFLAAGGYHHHLGINSWQSAGGPRPPARAPGLRQIGFELDDRPGLLALAEAAREAGASPDPLDPEVVIEDPDGIMLSFGAPA